MLEQIKSEIVRFVTDHPGNRVPESNSPYFDCPLVGFSRADDQLFTDFKQIIGPFHLTPEELLPGAASVISWILPISSVVRETNRMQTEWPSREWAQTRTNGETLNGELRRHMVTWLEGAGQRCVAPQYSPLWQEFPDTAVGIVSSWSERHAAYVAGLGTFSLSDGFITVRGIAHRCGSIVTDLRVASTPRFAPNHRHNCLYFRNGSCGACIKRCPVGAITHEGHDKPSCREYVYKTVPQKLSGIYGVPQLGCGLCQTRVPCESMIPPVRCAE
jgi:epoxyqueuosine reductase QueG